MKPVLPLLDATWPAAAFIRVGPWLLREGQGGGQRVSAATAADVWAEADIPLAEVAQENLGQSALFMVQAGETALDAVLAARGYEIVDPVTIWSAPTTQLAAELPPLATFALWPPLAILHDIWADGHIDARRLAVMDRAAGPKIALLSRAGDRAVGAAFVACHQAQAMLHALHVLPAARRQGAAKNIMRAAANWALDQGATTLSLAVTRANAPANALYASLGMQSVGHYHYRRKPAHERQTSS